MTIYNSDYLGMQLSKARQDDLRREAQRVRLAQAVLRLRPIRRLIRLPKITISWN